MSITFLNSFFLLALAAGAIPILIHRLVQRHGRVQKFSAVRLLLQSQQNLVRPERLKQFILLALRVLAVMSLVLVMARPVWIFPGVFSSGEEGAKVLILDNSMSMGYREDQEERFELAKKQAGDILKTIKGQVLILPTSAIPGKRPVGPSLEWMNPGKALQELGALSLSYGKGDPAAALNLALQKGRDAKAHLEIVILTDLARGDWEGFHVSQLKNIPPNLSITFIRFGGKEQDSNLAIKEVRLNQGEAVLGAPHRLDVTIGNFFNQANSTQVQIYLGGSRLEQKSIDLPAGEEGKVSFDLLLEQSGWVKGEVRLTGDRLPFDDRFYFPIKVREKIRILVVDGDPRTSIKASESYYLVNALQPGGGERTPFITEVIQEGELERVDLKPYEAIFLLNVSQPPSSPLSSFLQAGKALFIFLGNRATPDSYHRLPFFPWQLKDLKERGTQGPLKPAGDSNRKSLKILSEPLEESLKKASFQRYYRIERSVKNLLTLENGDPLLVEGEWGKGKIFLFASSADLDWNNLPLNAAYLPLIQGLIKESVGLRQNSPPTLRVGESFPETNPPAQIAGPPGGPGIYQFHLASGEVWLAVNPPPEESDLRKMTTEEMQNRFGSIEVKVVESREGVLNVPLAGRKELWPFILGFLLLVLGIEMGVASRV